jgi:hypothetical protein
MLRHIGRCELMFGVCMDVVRAYNKMHACLTFHSILGLGLSLGLAFKVHV